MPVSPRPPPSSTFPFTPIVGSPQILATIPIPPLRAHLLLSSPTLINDHPPSNAIPSPHPQLRTPLPQHSLPLRGVKAQTSSSPVANGKPSRSLLPKLFTCLRSRARKIRCDSTRPICHNCVRRSNECQYDAVPKRRGPDKRPGTRQRSCKKRPADGSAPPLPPSKRKRTTPRVSDPQEGPEDRRPLDPPALRTSDLEQDGHIRLNQPSLSPQGSEFSSSAPSRGLSADTYSTVCLNREYHFTPNNLTTLPQHPDRHLVDKVRIPATPSVQYNRKEWWDNLVNSYSTNRDQS